MTMHNSHIHNSSYVSPISRMDALQIQYMIVHMFTCFVTFMTSYRLTISRYLNLETIICTDLLSCYGSFTYKTAALSPTTLIWYPQHAIANLPVVRPGVDKRIESEALVRSNG